MKTKSVIWILAPYFVCWLCIGIGMLMVHHGWFLIGLGAYCPSFSWARVFAGTGNYIWGFGVGFMLGALIYKNK